MISSCAHEEATTEWAPVAPVSSPASAGGDTRATKGHDFYLGVDIGRKHDLTIAWLFEKVGGVLWSRRLLTLKGVSFDVHRGSVVSMIGASGSGKSTLLRCINHLETPTAGDILIDGESLCFRGGGSGDRRPRPLAEINRMRRDLGTVFQQLIVLV